MISISPGAGTQVAPGSTVTIVVSTGPAVQPEPEPEPTTAAPGNQGDTTQGG